MFLFAIQIKPPEKYVYVNFVSSDERKKEVLADISNKKHASKPRIIPYLEYSGDYRADNIRKAGDRFLAKLNEDGYIPVDGGLLTGLNKIYVIHMDSPDSNMVYVGRTAYSPEIRLMQHKLGIKSARIFKKHAAHSLAADLMTDKDYYPTTDMATRAETRMAKRLEKLGYEVYYG